MEDYNLLLLAIWYEKKKEEDVLLGSFFFLNKEEGRGHLKTWPFVKFGYVMVENN